MKNQTTPNRTTTLLSPSDSMPRRNPSRRMRASKNVIDYANRIARIIADCGVDAAIRLITESSPDGIAAEERKRVHRLLIEWNALFRRSEGVEGSEWEQWSTTHLVDADEEFHTLPFRITLHALYPRMLRRVETGNWTVDTLLPMLHQWSHMIDPALFMDVPLEWILKELPKRFADPQHADFVHDALCIVERIFSPLRPSMHKFTTGKILEALASMLFLAMERTSDLTRLMVLRMISELPVELTKNYRRSGFLGMLRLASSLVECEGRMKACDVQTKHVLMHLLADHVAHFGVHAVHDVLWSRVVRAGFSGTSFPLVEAMMAHPSVLDMASEAALREVVAQDVASSPWSTLLRRVTAGTTSARAATLTCKLSGKVGIDDPMVASDGYMYERATLVRYLQESTVAVSPWTGRILRRHWMARNHALLEP